MSTTTAPGSSSFAHVSWALRRYGWLLVVCVLALMAAAGWVQSRQDKVYAAEALVVAQQLSLDPETLPGYAETVFASGSVARAVASTPGLDVEPEGLIPDRLEVLTAPDSVAAQVVGRDVDPEKASTLANEAAEAFVAELNRAGPGVGVFALQDRASLPTRPITGTVSLPVALAGGAVLGALLGGALIALLLLLRRPVVAAHDAEEVVGLPVFGVVELPRLRSSEFPGPRGVPGIAAVTRKVLEAAPTALLITAPSEAAAARRRIAVMLTISLLPFRGVTTRMIRPMEEAVETHRRTWLGRRSSTQVQPGGAEPALVLVDGAEPLEIMEYQDHSRCTLLVVPQGMTTRRLRMLVSEYLEGELDGLVLYRTVRRRRRGSVMTGAGEDVAQRQVNTDGSGHEDLVEAPRR